MKNGKSTEILYVMLTKLELHRTSVKEYSVFYFYMWKATVEDESAQNFVTGFILGNDKYHPPHLIIKRKIERKAESEERSYIGDETYGGELILHLRNLL